MTIDQLEYFCAVAEEKNFTRAAKRKFVAQTAISQQIKSLEKELGFQLFERNNRMVRFTPAGEAFYEGVVRVLLLLDNSVKKAKQVAMQSSNVSGGFIRIGYVGHLRSQFLPKLISTLYRQNNTLDITLNRLASTAYGAEIEMDAVDVNFILGLEQPDERKKFPDIMTRTVARSKWCVVVSMTHRLSERVEVDRSELSNERIVMIDPNIGGEAMVNYTISKCLESGFDPSFLMVKDLDEAFKLIEAGICVGFYPEISQREGEPTKYIPLSGEGEYVDVEVQWSKNNRNAAINEVLKLLDDLQY